ncbi:MAG: ABC transporter permease [Defluviitaleaceae bacterium]|nr:ABC transporter permease [Defluviitaleaceae bacterium]
MKHVNAIFYKQLKDTIKNPAVLMQFIIFPLLAFVLTFLMNMERMTNDMLEALPYGTDVDMVLANMNASMPNMTTMQATVFAGMGLIPIVASIIAEDIEKKSLRFLSMAGIRPTAYLVGIAGVIMFVSLFTSAAFSLIAGFTGLDFIIFTAAMMSGVAGSIVLGATFGIMTRNQQAAAGITMPIALILGFGPIMAQMNPSIARFLHVVYTQQLNVVADYLTIGGVDTPLWQSFGIMWANVALLGLLFVLVFRRKWSIE